MSKIAVCIFGREDKNISAIKEKCKILFSDNIDFFFEPNNCVFTSLWLTANKKRQNELLAKKEYDLCLGIMSSSIDIIDIIKVSPVVNNVLYYSTGRFNGTKCSTEIIPSGFYADSITFDRASEFVFTKIKKENLRVDNIESRFYFHLKYLKINTECINYENSSLFKWTTQNS